MGRGRKRKRERSLSCSRPASDADDALAASRLQGQPGLPPPTSAEATESSTLRSRRQHVQKPLTAVNRLHMRDIMWEARREKLHRLKQMVDRIVTATATTFFPHDFAVHWDRGRRWGATSYAHAARHTPSWNGHQGLALSPPHRPCMWLAEYLPSGGPKRHGVCAGLFEIEFAGYNWGPVLERIRVVSCLDPKLRVELTFRDMDVRPTAPKQDAPFYYTDCWFIGAAQFYPTPYRAVGVTDACIDALAFAVNLEEPQGRNALIDLVARSFSGTLRCSDLAAIVVEFLRIVPHHPP